MNTNKFQYWPSDGQLGSTKFTMPTNVEDWPSGDALIGNFVYSEGELVDFIDTKALIVNESKITTINYDYVNIELPFAEDAMTINRGPRNKYLIIKFNDKEVEEGETFNFVIIDFNTTDEEIINTVRSAKRIVNNKLYDVNDSLIGTIDTSKIEVGGNVDIETLPDGLFCNLDAMTMGERGIILSEFNSDLSSLRAGDNMFINTNLTSFTSNLSNITDGYFMFFKSKIESFSSDLSSLTRGYGMFYDCTALTTFNSNLSSLTNGPDMFRGCKLDTASVQNIADTIKKVTGLIHGSTEFDEVFRRIDIGIGNSTPNEQEKAAFDKIESKGWFVYVNGSEYTPTSLTTITTLDENGEETTTPIPYYAKAVPATEETASYVDSDGNYYNILGAQFIYGDDLSTYGMFTCEADAAANMRLRKIEKPQRFALKP